MKLKRVPEKTDMDEDGPAPLIEQGVVSFRVPVLCKKYYSSVDHVANHSLAGSTQFWNRVSSHFT
ncbi:MAG: hypothetical protein CMJ81_00685 [Planctomycetaceae bacterium]|nr:hypothetical protein [Planctomycetaceae bacterium]MBP63937.1 hypothetical protein [Planctomycetaceae bacterium]